MSTMSDASLMVELQQDAYTSKTRESRLFDGNQAERFRCLGADHYLVVLYFPASACQSHPMYRQGLGNVYYRICITCGGVITRRLHLEDERIPTFRIRGKPSHSIRTFGCQPLPCCALFSCQCLSKPSHVQVRTWECPLQHMHHSWWSYNKTPTPQRRENPTFSREIS